MQQAREQMPMNLVIDRLKGIKAEVQRLAGMPVLVNDKLKGKSSWPIAYLDGGLHFAAAQ